MILPILAYGDTVLKMEAADISKDYSELDKLIDNMFETMYNASGVGLAAPQIGKSIRLFIVDASPFGEDEDDPEALKVKDFKEVFINAQIVDRAGDEWLFQEGCLSIPNIREDVNRESTIRIQYYDRNWHYQEKEFDGYAARIIQHEYDHIDGILFTDLLNPLKKRMLKRKLQGISRGEVDVNYKMKFPILKAKKR
ncbi:peptide deformylase [Cryomorpha ignava]|uniref:Peptide deformylase n=1 Tax=Cryomorpha ignava TaxID=101383 RepID=A0A7K3WSB5_9FLAO|nr:peptide deformylase [Cryomorpha ignava]NEN24408.1 peptide deformylase [Cryomorpha ignava]